MTDSSISTPEIHLRRESCWPEILKRLPAKQLGICLCVSKKWNLLINSSAFITSHINHLKRSNLFLLRTFLKKNPHRNPKEFYYICPETLETLAEKSFDCPFKSNNGLQFRMVGSVNGVVFLSDDCFKSRYTFILWNPLVKCFIHLPKPKACFDFIGPYMSASGFGYDGVKDDFKVVRMVYPQRKDGLDETPPRAEVYSVNEGKWRWVCSDGVEWCTVDKEWSQCFLEGSVHWVAYDRWGEERNESHKGNVLLLFNVEKEVFLVMELPVELREVCPLRLGVSECRGMLCVVEQSAECCMWVMKEYSKSESWMKVASVDVRDSVVEKIIYRKENGELWCSSKREELVSFDPVTKKVMVLASGVAGLYEAMYDVCSFVESLAFLNPDCKNRSCFVLEEDGDDNSDDEELAPQKMELVEMMKFLSMMNQMNKFRREF